MTAFNEAYEARVLEENAVNEAQRKLQVDVTAFDEERERLMAESREVLGSPAVKLAEIQFVEDETGEAEKAVVGEKREGKEDKAVVSEQGKAGRTRGRRGKKVKTGRRRGR